jgi:hypothetical protein
MNNSPLTLPTDRLVDYFCVCGTPNDAILPVEGPSESITLDSVFMPTLLERYPLDDHDTPFPTGVPNLCFPSGIQLRHTDPEEPLPTFFTAVATGSKQEHVYVHVLRFWERPSVAQLTATPALAALVGWSPPATPEPVAEPDHSHGDGECEGHAADGLRGGAADAAADGAEASEGAAGPLTPAARSMRTRVSSTGSHKSTGSRGGSSRSARGSGGSRKHADDADGSDAGHESDDPAAAAAAAEAMQAHMTRPATKVPIFLPRTFCVLSRWNFPGFRAFLTNLYRVSLSPCPVPLERIVCNFVSEVPLPPAGKVEVQWSLGVEPITFRRPPKNRRVSAYNLPFREVFEALDLSNLLTLVRCLLTDKQVLLVSSQLSLLTAAAEVLVSLIYPFRWPHAFIPVLPRALLTMLQAPFPFIVGLPLHDYEQVMESVPPEVVTVLLDRNVILASPSVTVPHIPGHQKKKLLEALRRCADVHAHRGADWATARLPFFDSAFDFSLRPSELEEREGEKGGALDDDEDAYANSDDDEKAASEAITRLQASASSAAGLLGADGGGLSRLTPTGAVATLGGRRSSSNAFFGDGARKRLGSTAASGGGSAYLSGGGLRRGLPGSAASAAGPIHVNFHAARRAFFRLFVSLLLRYREFVVYPSAADPAPRARFDKRGFLEANKLDARPLLEAIMETQVRGD